MTVITCPHCGQLHYRDVSYDPFESSPGYGFGAYFRTDETGESRKLKPEGVSVCGKCKRQFMYKFKTVVECDTAPYPFAPS